MNPTPRFLFLISLPRSGSTLLQRMLASSPQVATLPEPWMWLLLTQPLGYRHVLADYSQRGLITAASEMIRHLPGGETEYWEWAEAHLLDIYAAAASRTGDGTAPTYLLDKTPRYATIAPELHAHLPHARFIVLWRDPRDILQSISSTWDDGRWRPSRWAVDLGDGMDGMTKLASIRDPARVTHIGYEEVVRKPGHVWAQLSEFLDLDLGPVPTSPDAITGPLGDQTGQHAYSRITTDSISRWVQPRLSTTRRRWMINYLEGLSTEAWERLGQDPGTVVHELQGAPAVGGWPAVADWMTHVRALVVAMMKRRILSDDSLLDCYLWAQVNRSRTRRR